MGSRNKLKRALHRLASSAVRGSIKPLRARRKRPRRLRDGVFSSFEQEFTTAMAGFNELVQPFVE